MTVPRKSELFQDDLYPPTASYKAALTANQWIEGDNSEPIMVSLREGYTPTSKSALNQLNRRPNMLSKGWSSFFEYALYL